VEPASSRPCRHSCRHSSSERCYFGVQRRLSGLKEVFQILEGWKSFLLIERRPDGQHSEKLQATITDLSQGSGTVKFSGYKDEAPIGYKIQVVLELGAATFFERSPSEGRVTAFLPDETVTFYEAG
jgi:hypothetical protein